MTTTTTAARTERQALRSAWTAERTAARDARRRGDRTTEWHHLERAHILSQPMALAHVRTHVAMLAAGMRRRDRTEVLGQVLRTVVAAPGSWTGRYPVGNTGGADVSALRPMPVPGDLQSSSSYAKAEHRDRTDHLLHRHHRARGMPRAGGRRAQPTATPTTCASHLS